MSATPEAGSRPWHLVAAALVSMVLVPLMMTACGAPGDIEPSSGPDAPAADETSADASGEAGIVPEETSPAGTAASRAYIDPQTGRLVPRPADADEPEVAPGMAESLSRYQGDLLEEPLEDGGVAVNLQGRFRTATVAHIEEDGTVDLDCVDVHEDEASEEADDER